MTGKAVVLLIEDDSDIRELLAARVRRLGMDVVTATTGAAGIDQARELRPTLVIIDLGLPDMDGWKVIESLGSDDRTREIPVLIASISDPPDDFPPRVRAHLVKPIKKGVLEEAVVEAIELCDS